jgi:putative ABC transport system ATP-binding protein
VTSSAPVLQVEDLSKTFALEGRSLTVLDGVSFAAQRGESIAISGPSGSGKSTLLGLVAGLDRPSRGRVVVDGSDLAGMDATALAAFRGRRMGFIFQSYRLLPTLTAEENVRVPLDLAGVPDARAKALAWLDRVGLADRAHHVPTRLSGGEQQRVAVARALVIEPSLIFADEPTGNLDSRTGAEIADLLFSLRGSQGATLVLVSHDPSLGQRADRRIQLRDGRIVA